MCWPRSLARARPSAVRVRIRSRSTSANPPRMAIISRPVLVDVSAHGSASDRNCAPASTMRLTMANRSKVERANRSMRVYRHHVAGCNGFQELQQLASVGLRAARLFAIDFGASLFAQLRELSIEGLPIGADAGIADVLRAVAQ